LRSAEVAEGEEEEEEEEDVEGEAEAEEEVEVLLARQEALRARPQALADLVVVVLRVQPGMRDWLQNG